VLVPQAFVERLALALLVLVLVLVLALESAFFLEL
jgi:hypothetical protein